MALGIEDIWPCQAKSKVIIQGRMTLEINIEGIRPNEYVLPRRICRRTETALEHKTLIQGIIVLRKMTRERMLKIIIIKIIAILLLLNDGFKVKLMNTNIYNNDDELVKAYRDVLIERFVLSTITR